MAEKDIAEKTLEAYNDVFADIVNVLLLRQTLCKRRKKPVIQKGIIQGEDTILSLMRYLLSNNRTEDAKKATEDKAYRNKLLTEVFGDKQ